MTNEVVSKFPAPVHPMLDWLQGMGLDFAANVLGAIAIFAVGAIAIRFLTKFLRMGVERKDCSRELQKRFFASVLVKCAWALLTVIALEKVGVPVTTLIAGLGVTGIILGFAFQETLGSLAAGIMLAFNHPFKIGDYVVVAGHEGIVKRLNEVAVVLATYDNRQVTIPNKQAWGSAIVNYSALKLRRVELLLGIAYGSDLTAARELGRTILAALPAVLKTPAPACEVKSLDDSAVVLTCRAWVKVADYWPTYFAANQRLHDGFMKAGFSIPFPQMDIHLLPDSGVSASCLALTSPLSDSARTSS